MNSIFEAIMLVCFGISWPVAIIKTLRVKTVKGISILFCFLVLLGYISGTIYKFLNNRDMVIFLYITNCFTVSTQIVLYFIYRKRG